MEKREYDRDEILIRQTLENEFPQNFVLQKGVVKEVNTKKMFKKGFVVALIAACLTAATVSAAYRMGAFERLTGIIGEEQADGLVPLEIVPEEPAQPNGEIAVELVAIEVSGNVANVYITMQDLVSNRLDNEFLVRHSILPADPVGEFAMTSGMPEIIHRGDDGVITLLSRFEFNHSYEGLALSYGITEIHFDDFSHPVQIMDINFADFAFDAPTAMLRTSDPAMSYSGETILPREEREEMRNHIIEHGLPLLAPNLPGIEIDMDRVSAVISGIGIVDGRLHVQIYNPDRNSHVTMFLLRSETDIDAGNYWQYIVPDVFQTQFRAAADGTLYREVTRVASDTHFESVYEVDFDNIHEYSLAVTAFGSERIDFDWSVTFDLNDYR